MNYVAWVIRYKIFEWPLVERLEMIAKEKKLEVLTQDFWALIHRENHDPFLVTPTDFFLILTSII